MNILKAYRRFPLVYKILIGFAAGIIAGLVFGESISSVALLGDLFLRALKMITMPLVFFTLVLGVASIEPAKMGRIFGKTLFWYLFTTLVAAIIGVSIALAINPGAGFSYTGVDYTPAEQTSFVDNLVSWIPTNPFKAIVEFQLIPTIIFALLFGICLSILRGAAAKAEAPDAQARLKRVGDSVYDFFAGASEVMYKMVGIVLEFSPYGTFALTATVVGETGISILLPYGKFILSMFVSLVIILAVFYSLLLRLYGLSPFRFYRGAKEAMLAAFVTRSSSGTLPVTMTCAGENLSIDRDLYAFTLPLGATINMNGSVVTHMTTAIFAATIFGVNLGIGQIATLILVAVMAAVGTAGVPMGSLITMSITLGAVGLPLEAIGLIIGIYVIIDMMITCVNVTGDIMCTSIIAKSEGMMDLGKGVWNPRREPQLEEFANPEDEKADEAI